MKLEIIKIAREAVRLAPQVRPHLSNRTRYILSALKGGEGSGNFGHAGRPGEVGGSASTHLYINPKKMPTHYKDAPITFWKKGRNGWIAMTNSYGIGVNTQSYTWKNMEQYQAEAFKMGWQSTPNPDHVIIHEYAHFWGSNNNPQYEYLRSYFGSHNPQFYAIASQVSKYATTNGVEFLSETYAGLVYGNTYTQEVMDLYNRYGGLQP